MQPSTTIIQPEATQKPLKKEQDEAKDAEFAKMKALLEKYEE